MNFKNQPLHNDNSSSSNPKNKAPKGWGRKEKTQLAILLGEIAIVVILIFTIYSVIKSLDFSSIIFSFGKTLQVDQYGHTNVLLVGIGGEGHDGPDLTDSIIVASIDYDHKLVPMISIPRDLYVKSKRLNTGERINAIYSIGKNKLNSQQGLEELKNIASEVTGFPIQYTIKVDFKGFRKIVDSLGGVDVIVEKDIYDVEYPLGETTQFKTFALNAGPQHLDGETALEFARSRHGKGNENGDFDRSHRQQQIIAAIKEKALNLNILTDPGKIKNLYDSVSSSIETDFSINEIIELAKTAKEFGKESIISRLISNSSDSCGGFLYNPPRENFSGASVLLPAEDNYNSIHEFAKNFFENPLLAEDQGGIQILNGTKIPNVAGEVMNKFNRLCYNVIYYGNAKNRDLPETTIYYVPGPKGEKPPLLNVVTKILPYKTQAGIPQDYLNTEKKQATQILIELGADYLKNRIKDPYNTPSSFTPTASPAPAF